MVPVIEALSDLSSGLSASSSSQRAIAVGSRRRTVVEGLRELGCDRGLLARVARAYGRARARARDAPRALAPTAGVDMNLALQPPRLGEAEVVAEVLEQGNRRVGDGDYLLDVSPRDV